MRITSLEFGGIVVIAVFAVLAHGARAQGPGGGPPAQAFQACQGKQDNAQCGFKAPHGAIQGTCRSMRGAFVCAPAQPPGGDQKGGDQKGGGQKGGGQMGSGGSGGIQPPAAPAADSAYPVVDTGQSRCYGTRGGAQRSCPKPGEGGFGQDAQYNLNSPRYRDNGDGTVSDKITGLMWEKGFTRNVPWRDAPRYAVRANTGGHADWRVPTIKELYSLMDFDGVTGGMGNTSQAPSDAKPYLDTGVFDFEYPTDPEARAASSGGHVRFIDAQYISSTAYQGLTMRRNATFFGVNFADGRIKGYQQMPRMRAGFYLRLVRGNPAYGRNLFRDDGNGVVTDRATGLAWMQVDSGHESLRDRLGRPHYGDGRMDWLEALTFCEGLSHAGFDDWRLPHAKELQSLVDYTRSPQSTRSAALDPLFHATPITDESGGPNFPGYWTSTTHLDGRYPGTDAIVVYFGEALGAFADSGGGMGGPPSGGMGGPPGMGGQSMGGQQGGPGGSTRSSGSRKDITDVHGAGA